MKQEKQYKKTILISLLSNVVIGNFRNLGGVLDEFVKKKPKDVKLVFLTAPGLSHKFSQWLENDEVVLEIAEASISYGYFGKLFQFFYSYLIFTGTTKILATFGAKADAPPAGRNRHLAPLKKLIASTFGRSKFIKERVIPFLFLKIYSTRPYKNIFDQYRPDLLFATSIAVLHDVELLAEAKRRGIRSVGMACNWDHLNKYFIPLRPNILLVQNEPMRVEAETLQSYDKKNVFVAGFPQFDEHLKYVKNPMPRSVFLKKFNIPESNKIILFISGAAYSLDEPDIVQTICEWIDGNKLALPAKVLLRPYVIGRDKKQEAEKFKNVLSHPAVSVNWLAKSSGPDGQDDYLGMLYHADIIIPIFSTMAIEAALFNKPTITIGFDGKKIRPFHQSIVRLEHLSHFKNVLDTGSVKIARNFEDLLSTLNKYLLNPNLDSEKRKILAEKMCYKLDGKSSERLADFIYNQI